MALALIQAQAQGNPFFTEELLDALVDADYLLPVAGVWTLSPPLVEALRTANCLLRVGQDAWQLAADAPLSTLELGIPTTVQGAVLARLDRLPEEMKLTLKTASVIGRVFDFDLLAQAHPQPSQVAQLTAQLEALAQRDFARLEAERPRLRYIFKHNITQEVVYQTLLTDQRQDLHLAVANALENAEPERLRQP